MDQLIVQIAAAVNMWTLYPSNHPRVVRAIEQIIAAIDGILANLQAESVTFLVVGEDLVVEGEVLRKTTLSHRQFVSVLERRGIERLTLAAGIDAEEASKLVAALATGEAVESSPHVILGRVQVNVDDEKLQNIEEQHEFSMENFERVRQAFARFRTDQKIPLDAMEQLVWGFIDSLSRTTRSVLPLARLKEHDEYTFIHSVNVSLLVLAQARSFGIQGAMLHAFGMAALLHDIGKLMVPLDVLNKPGKLEGEQWLMMQSHAEKGAWFLSDAEGSTPLSILVAYEHHLRYDGQAAYPILAKPRMPNVVSRMTSIADAYDAMSTVRPYQKPLMRSAAIDILKKRSEAFYDPLLVGNFIHILESSGALPPREVA
jgi:HD-GYP domain-containing protein (c-di-GMP phosphodiesterase class II)